MAAKAVLVAVMLLVAGCGNRSDTATLEIAESLSIADLQIETGTRTDRFTVSGQPDSGFPTYARVTQVYQPEGDNPREVRDELRRLVEADGWVIETADEDHNWRTAERTIEDRTFFVRTGFNPNEGTVSLRIEEKRRNSG